MYSNKLAVAIKANGKVLREFEDQVFLPFQTQYNIFIKNKNSVRASVKIEIDGIDATEGVSLVVEPNDEIELERFIKNGNLDVGNRFKFIARTKEIEHHRGSKVDDGLIRVEFQFEKVQPISYTPDPQVWIYPPFSDPYHNPPHYSPTKWYESTGNTSSNLRCNTSNYVSNHSEIGITAPGSISNQEFSILSNFPLETQKHVMILRLMGEHKGRSVSNAVTTRSRTQCITCGHISKSTSARFCSQCGAGLQIIN